MQARKSKLCKGVQSMGEIIEWVSKNWVDLLFTGLLGVLGTAFTLLKKRVNRQVQEQFNTTEGVRALLHDRLYQACTFYLNQGWCSIDDKKNIEYMFDPYHNLGGNGTCENLFQQLQKLPMKEEK